MASRTPGAGRAVSAPAKRIPFTSTLWWKPTKYSWNPISTNPGSTNPGSTSPGSTNPGSTNPGSAPVPAAV